VIKGNELLLEKAMAMNSQQQDQSFQTSKFNIDKGKGPMVEESLALEFWLGRRPPRVPLSLSLIWIHLDATRRLLGSLPPSALPATSLLLPTLTFIYLR
jgi:hypothetical protein